MLTTTGSGSKRQPSEMREEIGSSLGLQQGNGRGAGLIGLGEFC
jgi:hypothetical protein